MSPKEIQKLLLKMSPKQIQKQLSQMSPTQKQKLLLQMSPKQLRILHSFYKKTKRSPQLSRSLSKQLKRTLQQQLSQKSRKQSEKSSSSIFKQEDRPSIRIPVSNMGSQPVSLGSDNMDQSAGSSSQFYIEYFMKNPHKMKKEDKKNIRNILKEEQFEDELVDFIKSHLKL
jgi:hypothetical protein